jgi:mRNA interferase MazF
LAANRSPGWKRAIRSTGRPGGFTESLPPEVGAGAVLADQVKSLDWRIRKAKRLAKAPKETVSDVLAKILALLGDDD